MMSATLRVILVVMSLLCAGWMFYNIRKAKIRIEDTVFWIFFSILLIVFSVFPRIVVWGAKITGVMSPANFIFLAVIFVLMVKLFRMTIRVSQLDSRLQTLAQNIALLRNRQEDNDR